MSRPTTRTVDEGSARLLGGIPVGRRGGRGGRGRGVTGPNLPERLELVGAALPDADRGRFEQQLDQALDTPRSSGTCGHVVEAWHRLVFARRHRGARWHQPRPGCARGEAPEWEAEPLDVEDAIGR